MKITLQLAAAAALALAITACGDAKVEAGELIDNAKNAASSALEGVDLSTLSPDALKEKAGDVVEQLTTKLKEIKDQASAEDIATKFKPVVDQLAKAKTMLGNNMPNMDSVKQAVADLKTKFADNEGIMKAIEPLLTKLQTLMQ